MAEKEIGKVTHYFGNIGVAAIEITENSLSIGDTIHFKGHTSDFTQTVDSMQLDGAPVQQASAGQSVGIKVTEHAREHDVSLSGRGKQPSFNRNRFALDQRR